MLSWQAWNKQLCAALATAAVASQAWAVPTLSVSTAGSVVEGTSTTVSVLVSDVADLFAYQFNLSFNPSLLQVTGGTEGGFLGAGGTTFFGAGTFDNGAGTVSFSFNTLLGDVSGVSGTGTLVSFSFNALQPGTSPLTLSNVLLLDSQLADITTTVQSGSLVVTAVPEPATLALFGLGLAAIARRRLLAA